MLADEAGLGKTLQAVLAAELPVLVACPSYLKTQWEQEIHRIFPTHTVAICEETREDREYSLSRLVQWTIVNIEMFRTYTFPTHYQTLIIDEAHHVRGHSAVQAQKARVLAKKIPRVYLLTATPIKKEVDDLFMQLSILDPDTFSSYEQFVNTYCVTVDNGWDTKVVRPKDPVAIRAIMNKYALRRTYKQVGLSRPKPIHNPIKLTPTKAWYTTYNILRNQYRLEDITFETAPSMIRELRSLTFDIKSVVAQRIYEDNPNTVFFVYYRDSAQALARLLDIPAIDGSMPPDKRAKVAKSGGSIVATISSLSEGVDLSHLSTICFVETSYVQGDKNQAIWRLVRWNEKIRPVRIFDLLVKGTIDITINEVLEGRTMNEQSILRQELSTTDEDV